MEKPSAWKEDFRLCRSTESLGDGRQRTRAAGVSGEIYTIARIKTYRMINVSGPD